MVKKSIILILFTLLISLTFGNEIFNNYVLNQDINSELLSSNPKQNKNLVGSIVTESGPIFLEYGGAWLLGTGLGLSLALGLAIDTFAYGIVPTFKEGSSLPGVGYLIGSTIGSALGTYLIGSLFHRRGRFLPSLIGSSLGTLSCLGLFLALGSKEVDDFGVTVLLLTPPAGAVIGYNLSRIKRNTKLSFFEEHFDQPRFSLRAERTKANEIIPVLDFKLVNARF